MLIIEGTAFRLSHGTNMTDGAIILPCDGTAGSRYQMLLCLDGSSKENLRESSMSVFAEMVRQESNIHQLRACHNNYAKT